MSGILARKIEINLRLLFTEQTNDLRSEGLRFCWLQKQKEKKSDCVYIIQLANNKILTHWLNKQINKQNKRNERVSQRQRQKNDNDIESFVCSLRFFCVFSLSLSASYSWVCVGCVSSCVCWRSIHSFSHSFTETSKRGLHEVRFEFSLGFFVVVEKQILFK